MEPPAPSAHPLCRLTTHPPLSLYPSHPPDALLPLSWAATTLLPCFSPAHPTQTLTFDAMLISVCCLFFTLAHTSPCAERACSPSVFRLLRGCLAGPPAPVKFAISSMAWHGIALDVMVDRKLRVHDCKVGWLVSAGVWCMCSTQRVPARFGC